MTGVLLVIGLGLIIAAGHLQRIADAIEAQNRAYGISAGSVKVEEEAA